MESFMSNTIIIAVVAILAILFGFAIVLSMFYKKVDQGKAIVRNGLGGPKVSFSGMWIIPIMHHWEYMDVSVKRVEIAREGKDGLICKDNLRADIRVAFFVRVNHMEQDVLRVAKSLGTEKASDSKTLLTFFDAKFSEALKTVGKQFDFVQLYTERDTFKAEILQVIGTDLNGYVLDDAAIDFLEQTDVKLLNPDNVLDAEGIKKINDLTAKQAIKSNEIMREKEKTIVQQDVATREQVLELKKQEAEAEAKQRREIENIKSREEAQIAIVDAEERLKSETARIKAEEELDIAKENKERQVIIAKKSKEATDAVETERVERQQLLERTEKEKLVTLAQIEKDKKVEEENKNIQEVIRERVIVQKSVVEEEEKIKDTKEVAEANRTKTVKITHAEADAEVKVINQVKEAEATKEKERILAEKDVILAETELKTSYKKAEATKIIADARAEEAAVEGISDARVTKAKAEALEAEGKAKASVTEIQAVASAKAISVQGDAEAHVIATKADADAKAIELSGLAEAKITKEKALAEADGINEKAKAMKEYDAVGKEHEEFKLRLDMEKEIQLAKINVEKEVAEAQASIISDGLKSSKIDIVGGDSMFFDKIVNSITLGKQTDRFMENSKTVSGIKDIFLSGDAKDFRNELKSLVKNFNMNTEDFKNMTISAAILSMMAGSEGVKKSFLEGLLNKAKKAGVSENSVDEILG